MGMRMRPVCEGINPLRDIVEGASHFQQAIAPEAREFFGNLAAGQAPKALFVTCSDSRINPFLITDTNPGDLFIMRNAGHIVPPYGAAKGGAEATVEFAVVALARLAKGKLRLHGWVYHIGSSEILVWNRETHRFARIDGGEPLHFCPELRLDA